MDTTLLGHNARGRLPVEGDANTCADGNRNPRSSPYCNTRTRRSTGRHAAPQDREALLAAVPALAERELRFAGALASDQPILILESGLDTQQQQAQSLAVADPPVPDLCPRLADKAAGTQ